VKIRAIRVRALVFNPHRFRRLKSLIRQKMAGLTKMIAATRDHEINCTECGLFIAEFAEKQMAGLPLEGAMAKVEQHLQICPECREELEVLENVLKREI
jgi:Zn finger protein HypA/HybF involved in hydrogenase expression